MGKISYERHVYDSVDIRTCLGIYLKNWRKTEFMQQMINN